jgi:flagellar motor protein MotB
MIGGIQGALSIMETGMKKQQMTVFKSKEESDGGTLQDGGKKEIKIEKRNLAVVNLRSLKIINRFNEFKDRLLELGFENTVTAKQLNEGIAVEITFDRIFQPGSAELDTRAWALFQSFANLASSVGNELRVTACFSLSDYLGGTSSFKNEWNLSRKRVMVIGENILHGKYHIPSVRLSYGIKVIEGDHRPFLELMLVEKIGTSEVSIKDLMNMSEGI